MNPDWCPCVLRVVLDWLLVVLHIPITIARFQRKLCWVTVMAYHSRWYQIHCAWFAFNFQSRSSFLSLYQRYICIMLSGQKMFGKRYDIQTNRQMAVRMYNVITIYMLAIGLTRAVTWLFKITTKANRPHFLDVCQPNITLTSCTGFVNEYSCQGMRTNLMPEINVSFVSGHSSVTAVAVMFIVLYLQERLQLSCAPLLRPMLQTAIVSFGLYVVISRYTDKKHHVSDIIAGTLVGAGSATAL
ncbi:PAP2 family protein, partial [Opisthorchis viverrini]